MADFKRPCLKPLGVQLRASMPALEKGGGSVARSNRANYGGDCFPLAQSLRCYPLTFKRVRFCCSVKPSQLWWGLPHPHHQLDFPHYPSKIANTLASLVKGRWIDGKAQAFILLLSACATSALFITKPFCRQDGGIAAPTFAPHYPTRFSCCEFDSPTYRKNKIRPRFHGGELIKSLIYKY